MIMFKFSPVIFCLLFFPSPGPAEAPHETELLRRAATDPAFRAARARLETAILRADAAGLPEAAGLESELRSGRATDSAAGESLELAWSRPWPGNRRLALEREGARLELESLLLDLEGRLRDRAAELREALWSRAALLAEEELARREVELLRDARALSATERAQGRRSPVEDRAVQLALLDAERGLRDIQRETAALGRFLQASTPGDAPPRPAFPPDFSGHACPDETSLFHPRLQRAERARALSAADLAAATLREAPRLGLLAELERAGAEDPELTVGVFVEIPLAARNESTLRTAARRDRDDAETAHDAALLAWRRDRDLLAAELEALGTELRRLESEHLPAAEALRAETARSVDDGRLSPLDLTDVERNLLALRRELLSLRREQVLRWFRLHAECTPIPESILP